MQSVKYALTYSDGTTSIKTFLSKKEAQWFIHNEGDHLVNVSLVWKSFRFHYRNGHVVLRTFKDVEQAYGEAYKDKEVIKVEEI